MFKDILRSPIRSPLRSVVPIYGDIWTPAQLFINGEQGVWYEPKPQYLYQDAAGTVPVTADGDPVGLMLDLHDGYGRGVVNLLTWSEDFTNAVWNVKANVTVETSAESFGSGTFQKLQEETATNTKLLANSNAYPDTTGSIMTYGVFAKYAGRFLIVRRDSPSSYAVFDLQNGVVTEESGATGYIAEAPEKGVGVYRCSITSSSSGTIVFGLSDTPTPGVRDPSYAGDGTSGVLIAGAQLELASQPSDYQKKTNTLAEGGNHATQSVSAARPIYRTDGTLHWLEFDGVDDWLTAGSWPSGNQPQPATMHAALTIKETRSGGIFSSPDSSARHQFYQANAAANYRLFAGLVVEPTSDTTPVPKSVFTIRVNGANSRISKNRVLTAEGDAGDHLSSGVIIGSLAGGSTPSHIDFYGLINVFGSPDDEAPEQYMADLAGITL